MTDINNINNLNDLNIKVKNIIKDKWYDVADKYIDDLIYNNIRNSNQYNCIYFFAKVNLYLDKIIELNKDKRFKYKKFEMYVSKLKQIIWFIEDKIDLYEEDKIIFMDLKYKYHILLWWILINKKNNIIKNPWKYWWLEKTKEKIKKINEKISANNKTVNNLLWLLNKLFSYKNEIYVINQILLYEELNKKNETVSFIKKVIEKNPKILNNLWVLYILIENLYIWYIDYKLNNKDEKQRNIIKNNIFKYIYIFKENKKQDNFILPNFIENNKKNSIIKIIEQEINNIKKRINSYESKDIKNKTNT